MPEKANVDRWFAPLRRGVYFQIGMVLMLLKYGVEAATVFLSKGFFFTPVEYFVPLISFREPYFENAQWLAWAWVIWSIPFLFIAVWLSIRRCIDAGVYPLYGTLVLVPILNYFVMFHLSFAPTKRPAVGKADEETYFIRERKQTNLAVAVFSGVLTGAAVMLAVTFLSVYTIDSYGGALFLGMPFVSGFVAAFVAHRLGNRGFWPCVSVGFLAVLLGGTALLFMALEGAICLIMAAPIVLPLGAIGGVGGWAVGTLVVSSTFQDSVVTCVLGTLPLIAIAEKESVERDERMVESVIVIDASPQEVWQQVIAFPEIESQPEWFFRTGIAYPVRARIDGEGVGAIRYCEFDTGQFVEPITVWDEPHRLGFDVTEQPEPMKELTPYKSIHPPHLDWAFKSNRGEFVLEEIPGGRTRLVGRTWYVVDMGPQVYWSRWTDWIIHRIHFRVLDHIKEVTEESHENR